eukprot:TRINITY_DN4858_c0_g1_i5.p1 TRINITY_DN4858_c0_g1~~TRINITY_DN4858_c0_g1_i5.p1  ORF type:complete len:1813 (+),score=508.06 TRINITY_DN4858_c0_g1_i5:67-5439(+)
MSDSEECLEQLVPDSSLNNYDSFGEAAGFGTSNAPTMETGKKSVVKKEGKMAAAVRIVKNMFICNNNKDDVDSEFKKDLSRKLANLEEAWYGGDVAQWDKWVATQEFVKWFKMQEHVFGVEQKPFKEEEWKGLYEAVYGILKILKISLMSDTMESDKRQLITFNNIHLHRSAAFLMFRLAKTTPPEDHNEKKLENLVKELEEVKYEARRHVVSITDFHIVSVGVKVIGQSDNELIESICKFGGTVFSIATGLPGSISKVGEFLKDGKKVIESIIEKVKAEGFITFSTYECFTLGVKCELLRNTVQALTDRKRDGDCLRLAETITSAIKSFHEDVIHDGSLKHADPTHALLWIANLAEMLLFNRAVVRSAGDWTGRISYGKADQKWYQRIPVENDPAATHTVKFPATATDVLLDCLLEFLTFERPSPEKLTEQIKDAKELVGGAVKYQAEKAGKGSVEFIREIDQWYNDTRGQSLESIDGSVSAMTDLLLGKDTSSNTSLKLRCRSVMACYEVIAFEDGRYLTDSQKHDVSEQLSRSLLCDREEVVGALHEALSFKGMKDYMGMTLPTQAKEYKKKISELLDEVDELLRLRGETVMKEAIKPLDKILQNAQRAITVYVRNLEGTSTMVGATMLLTAGILNRAVQIEKAVQDIAKDVSDIHEYLELHRELEDDILRMKHQCERTDEYSFLKVSFSDNTTKEKETETVDGFVKRILGWKNHEEDNSFVFDGNQSGCEEFLRLVEKRLWECYKDKKKEEEEEAAQDLVPVFIYLPKLKDPREKLVEGALKEYGFTVSNIRKLKEKSGEDYKLVLILEGYSHLDREFTFNILRKSNALSEWGDPIILVSANVAFLQYTHQKLFGSVDKDGKMMSRCQVLRIEDLTTEEAEGIIVSGKATVWQRRVFEKFMKYLGANDSVLSLSLVRSFRDVTSDCMCNLCEEPVLDLSFLRSNVERYFMLSKDMFYEKYPSMSDRNIMTLMFDYNGSLALQMARQQTTIAHYHKRCDLFLEECDLSTFDLEEERRMQFVRDMYASSPLRTVLGPSGKKTFRFVDMWLQYAFTAWAIRDKLMEFPLNRCATRFFVSTFSNLNEKQKEELTHEEQVRVLFSKECHVMQARVADALDVSEQQASEYLVQTCNAACADWDVKMEYLMCFPVVLRQYVAKMASEKCFKDTLYSLLELSKLKFCKVPGAVAMTILSAANEAFAGMDLRGVSVKGAHLDDNTFDRTLLNEDDLKDTCHPRAHLGKFGADGKMKVTSRPLPGLVSFAAMTRRSDEDYVAEVYRDRVRFGGEDIVFSQKIPDSVSSSSVHSRIVWRNGFVVLVVSWVAGGIPHVVDVNMKNNRATKVEECNTSTLAASRIIGITDHGMVWMLNTRLRMKEGIEDSSLGNAKSMCIIKTDKDMGICWVTKAGVLHAGIVEVKEDYPSANSLLTGVSSDRRRTVEQVYPYKHEEIEQNPVWSAVTPMVDKVLAWRRDTQKRWECSVFTLPEETRTLRKHSTFYIDTDIDPATATTSNDVVSVVSKDGLSIHSWVVQRETAKRLYTRSLDLHVNSVKDVRLSETHLHCILVGENNAVISMAIPSAAPFSLGTISRVAVSESGNKVALLVDEGGGSFDLIVRNQELGATSRLYQKAKFAAVLGLTREGDTFSLKAKRQRMGKKLEEKEAYHYEVGDIGLEALELRIGDRPLPCAACDKTREQEAKTMREEGKRVLKEEVAAEQSEELLEHVEYVEKQGKTLVALAGGKAYIWRSISALSEQYGLPDWHETRYKWYFTKRVTMVEEVSVSVPTINAAEE